MTFERRRDAASAGDEADADSHVRFVYAALLSATLGGFTLAVWLPVRAATSGVDASWVSHAQVHGHLQVVGFAGLFVLGVATKLAPRFGRGHLVRPGLVDGAFWCVVAGLVGRVVGQPLADRGPFGLIAAAGASFELAGAAMFATSLSLTLAPAVARGAPHALFMLSGAAWFVAQAALGVLWVGQLAADHSTVLPADRGSVLVVAQAYGFLLSFFVGVGMRSFPSFFGMPAPSVWLGRAAFLLLEGGVLLWTAGGIAAEAGAGTHVLTSAGQALAGAGVLTAVSAFGWWRRETRFAVASQPLSWPLRATLLMLTLTALLLAGTGVEALARDEAVSFARSDAIRHLLSVGVITQGIVTMAQLILPEFASERLVRPPRPARALLLAGALTTAAILRGLVPMLGVAGDTRSWSMAAAGSLALVAVTAFAVSFVRARRTHRVYLERVVMWRNRALPVVDRPAEGMPPVRRGGPPLL